MKYQQFIVITGGVGVGKSTLIHNLKRSLPKKERIFIKEYIDFKPSTGKKMLEETLKGKGSMYELQLFIIDCFKEQLERAKQMKYVIMERSPIDSIFIFSNEAYFQGRMTTEEYNDLKVRVDDLYTTYGIPRFNEMIINRIDSCKYTINGIFEYVKYQSQEYWKQSKSALFLLYCSDPLKQKENIEKRGRPEEKDYDINYMIRINNEYSKLFAEYI
ncbi:hypothetical protein EHI8A_098040 [Entamoeba histolytica HM-1:IMSS-B]|uniref:Deoxynucleoside kinase domain-containing protein n=8 Tax=Entamoeba TaxID=5758 RepID=C4M5I9_ENTH1|nr:hypothetical protein EHI_001780 [Entamoeba histolytica HM-1:IMSS]EMD45611.1 Hypothetical protein EHI5A_069340 [Entamoeba histolytica KU27]EMH72113.1 hypothetical protein EHI8A_098040 [Entamoeba histolytica HM-1:IMSS-B]EMS13881.1 hypothetical protein KM1_081160 [Entamoeba histolytica HM-3:IMSS]ENY62682.1 hypothetical protein EHI7A_093990 [Entamoeba histolytica HM-1:IMSS-A]BAN38131.1 hypothetical protein [Entamoeba histolytica]|eukprot:XP_650037.1 hypothetical protein EHI_001780 [Entamoeba histolytica HM-1:IMSS]